MQKLTAAVLLLLALSVQARHLSSSGSSEDNTQIGDSTGTLQLNNAGVLQYGSENSADISQQNVNVAKSGEQTGDSTSSNNGDSTSTNGGVTQLNNLALAQLGKKNQANISQRNVNINKNVGEGQQQETPGAGGSGNGNDNNSNGNNDNNNGGQNGSGDGSGDNGDWSKHTKKPVKPEEKPAPKPTVTIAAAKPAPAVTIVKKPAPPTVVVVKPCPKPLPVCSDEVAAACCEGYELTCDAQYKPIHPQTCTVKKLVGAVVKDCTYSLDQSDYNPLVWTYESETCVCPQPVKKVVVAVQASADAYASSSGGN